MTLACCSLRSCMHAPSLSITQRRMRQQHLWSSTPEAAGITYLTTEDASAAQGVLEWPGEWVSQELGWAGIPSAGGPWNGVFSSSSSGPQGTQVVAIPCFCSFDPRMSTCGLPLGCTRPGRPVCGQTAWRIFDAYTEHPNLQMLLLAPAGRTGHLLRRQDLRHQGHQWRSAALLLQLQWRAGPNLQALQVLPCFIKCHSQNLPHAWLPCIQEKKQLLDDACMIPLAVHACQSSVHIVAPVRLPVAWRAVVRPGINLT